METQTYLTMEEVVEQLVKENVISSEVSEALKTPHYYNESPLEEDEPTQLFIDLVAIAGYKLNHKRDFDSDHNEYWLTKL